MRKFYIIPIVIFLLLLYISFKPVEHEKSQKPNIIFIMLDDLGYSQVAWNSRRITADDYDPKFLDYTLERGDYQPDQALEFSRIATPTMTKMAMEGLNFNNAFVPSNLCAPSRIGIATGILQNRWGIYRNIDTEAHGPKPNSLLVEILQEVGYRTAHIGKWHIGSRDRSMIPRYMEKHGIEKNSEEDYPPLEEHPEIRQALNENGFMGSSIPEHHALNNGFDFYYGYNMWESPFYDAENVWNGFEHAGIIREYNTDHFTEKAFDFIEESVEEQKPFFIQLHYHAVHGPLDPKAPDRYYDKFDSESYRLNNFYAHIYGVDENVRRLKELLEEKGLIENTLVVFTSDNGGAVGGFSSLPGNAPYRGHKGNYFLGGIKVPMFISWPGMIEDPVESDHLVSALDIMPTVIDAAGGSLPANIDGKSLLPILKGTSDDPVREYLLWSGVHARMWGFTNQTSFLTPYEEREQAPAAWGVVKDGYIMRYVSETKPGLYKEIPEGRPPSYELYNYITDPGETVNLFEKEPEIAKELLDIWEKEARSFPPPVRWRRDRWGEIVPIDNKHRTETDTPSPGY